MVHRVARLVLLAFGVSGGTLLSPTVKAAAAFPQIALVQILAEAETQLTARRHGEVALLLDRVLARVGQGERLPDGLALDRLSLAAATAHFRSANLARALELAQPLSTSRGQAGLTSIAGEARWLSALCLAGLERFKDAVPLFASLAVVPAFRDKAWLYEAMASQQAGLTEGAIEAYHRHLAQAPRNEDWADAALAVIALHLERGEAEEAQRGLRLLSGALERVDNVAGLTLLSLKLGDVASAADDAAGALAAYRTVRSLDEVKRLQAERDQRIEAQLAQSKALSRTRPDEIDTVRRLENRRSQSRIAWAELQKIPHYDATILHRLGHAFQQRGNIWEAALVYERLLKRFEQAPERERAFAGLVAVYAESGRNEKTVETARRFLLSYPQSEFAAQALFIAAVKAQERGEVATQLDFIERALASRPAPALHESLQLMQAHALFAAGRHGDARASAEVYVLAFPDGRFLEDAFYLQAMAGLILGPAARSLDEIQSYLTRFPAGRFVADARYRLVASHYGLLHYHDADLLATDWLESFPEDHPQRGEVLSLQGDVRAAEGKSTEAIASYRAALEHPLADEGLGYVMDELTRLHLARQEFDEAAERWEAFVEERPEHPFAINAAYWIGRIRTRQGQREEALEKMAAIARRHLADPDRDTVERLLLELAKVAVSRAPGSQRHDSIAKNPVAPEAWTATVEKLLLVGTLKQSATARARVFFVEAEIASLLRQPERCDALFQRLAETFSPEVLPPGILGRVADHVFEAGKYEQAEAFYRALVERAPKSLFADFGYVGLGEIALLRGEPEAALDQFTAAIDKAGAHFKLREATLGRAKSLLALEQWEPARALFEQIAGNRSWRGEATVQSVFALGEILSHRGDRESLAQAQAHFQRVYVGYRKFIPWVARAYLRSAETFEQLGQKTEALATYHELLRDSRLTKLPEARVAETNAARLLGQGA